MSKRKLDNSLYLDYIINNPNSEFSILLTEFNTIFSEYNEGLGFFIRKLYKFLFELVQTEDDYSSILIMCDNMLLKLIKNKRLQNRICELLEAIPKVIVNVFIEKNISSVCIELLLSVQ